MSNPFPIGVGFVPIPAPLLGELLSDIKDLNELKIILRCIWHIHQKKGTPRIIRRDELYSDPSVAQALGVYAEELERAVSAALNLAVSKGIFLEIEQLENGPAYVLNTEPERRSVLRTMHNDVARIQRKSETSYGATNRPTIFGVYEQNIGPLTPVISDRINEAQITYPEKWICEAIEIAAENGVRNWRYVAAVRANRLAGDMSDGKSGKNSEEDRLEPYKRAWKKYVRKV